MIVHLMDFFIYQIIEITIIILIKIYLMEASLLKITNY
jgi:hypothetical protein